jgi:MFS family permease
MARVVPPATNSSPATNSMLCLAQSSIGACGMSTNITFALVMIGFIISIYLAGRIAERRGRSFKIWAWIAAVIGPLALPLVFLFPNLHRKNGNHA